MEISDKNLDYITECLCALREYRRINTIVKSELIELKTVLLSKSENVLENKEIILILDDIIKLI